MLEYTAKNDKNKWRKNKQILQRNVCKPYTFWELKDVRGGDYNSVVDFAAWNTKISIFVNNIIVVDAVVLKFMVTDLREEKKEIKTEKRL